MDALQRLAETDDPELQEEQHYALLAQFIEARDRIGLRSFPIPAYVGFFERRHVYVTGSDYAAFTAFIFNLAGWVTREVLQPDEEEMRLVVVSVPQERYACHKLQSRFISTILPRRGFPWA